MNYQDRIESLLKLLPHKLQVSYALACAESVFEYVRDEDKEVIRKTLDITKLWLEDKVTADEVKVIYNAPASAYSATYSAANSAAYSTASAYAYSAACFAAKAADITYLTSNSAYSAAYCTAHAIAHLIGLNEDFIDYYNLLLKMIKENMNTLDRILLNIEDLTLEKI